MSELPFDTTDPPARPPAVCRDHLMWNLAHKMFRDHRPDRDGFCITCVPSEFSPCIGRFLATRGFLVACGVLDPNPAWEAR